MSVFSHDKTVEILLMSWADKHPYLFTIIQITSPTLYIILAVAGFNMVNGLVRSGRKWQRH
jgi:ABC-type lipoprotein release transport system permease subunit